MFKSFIVTGVHKPELLPPNVIALVTAINRRNKTASLEMMTFHETYTTNWQPVDSHDPSCAEIYNAFFDADGFRSFEGTLEAESYPNPASDDEWIGVIYNNYANLSIWTTYENISTDFGEAPTEIQILKDYIAQPLQFFGYAPGHRPQ